MTKMRKKNRAFSLLLFIVFIVQLSLPVEIATSQALGMYYPTGYYLLGATAYISGVLTDLQSDNGVYMTLQSYASQTSAQTLYAHQETTIIAGTSYYLLKLNSADASGTSLSASMASTGRQLWGKSVYQLTGVTSIPASTWTIYYRTWHSGVLEDILTNSPSFVPVSLWSNPEDAYSSDDAYADTDIDGAMQPYGNYGFNVPAGAILTKVEVGYEAFTSGDEKIGITCSWDGGTNWATEYVSPILGTTDPDTVTWVDFTDATSWTPDKLSDANFLTRAKGIRVGGGAMDYVFLDWIPARVTYVAPASAHADVDILVRKSDGTIRQTIATNVANSANLTATAQTLTGVYSWSAYTVVEETDYLEIDYYLDVTTAKAGVTAYLRIDDDTLTVGDQTKTTDVMLPSEYTAEAEFTGLSNTNYWSKLVWIVDSAWTTANVAVTLQLYNYTLGDYPTTGNGCISYTSNITPDTDETKNQTITTNPAHFRNSLGNWKIKVKGVRSTATQFDFKADLIKLEVTGDTTPPVWSNAGTNSTTPGQSTLFYVRWTDNTMLSGFIFGTNNTGKWENDTWTPMGGTSNWSNVTKALNSTAGIVVQWRVWANDTSNNWNKTGILSIKTLQLPFASFTFSPLSPMINETVTFDASGSSDPDGTIVSFKWNFGDGNITTVTSPTITHSYKTFGNYSVILNVTDNDNFYNSLTLTLTVHPPPSNVWDKLNSYTMPISIGFILLLLSAIAGTILIKRNKHAATPKTSSPEELGIFDTLASEAIPDAYSVMIVGDAGAGKSVLCQQLVNTYLKQGKPCIYVTYDCFPNEIKENMKALGWDTTEYEQNETFLFIDCYSSTAGVTSQEKHYVKQPFALSELGITISAAVENSKQKSIRIFLDSTVPLFTRLDPAKVVEFLQDRSAQIKGENGVFFFTIGKGTVEHGLTRRLEEIVDCIIELDIREEKGETKRKIRIRKLRGRRFFHEWVSFKIEQKKGFALLNPKKWIKKK